jgi:hypothetical protein
MNAGKAVYGILSTNAEVTAIVGTKIFPEVAEQEAALPLIVYQLQSVAPEDTHDGPSKLDEVRFEFLCYADTYNGAADLGDKVRGALDRVSGTYNAVNVESVQFNDVDIDVIDAPRRYGQSLTFTFRIKRDNVEIAQGTPVTGAMLGDLYNVDVAGVTDNQILSYDAATGNWVPADDAGGLVDSVNGLTGTVILNFDDLNDVDTGTPSDGQLIAYQQGEWVTIDQDELHIPINSVTGLQTELNTIPTDLSDLSDVSIVGTPAGNQALIYNSATNAFTSQDSYTNRFEDEVETGKVMPTIFAERAYSVKSEGDGVFIDPESDTPAAGKVIVRKIYHKAGFITDADVIGDYTLIHTFADDTAYADTVATFEGFEDGATYGVPPFTLLQTWEEVAAAPTFTGLLNESYGSGAEAAYSTRRLNGNITDCMVIRRASDSTTQTIGFDANGNIDEAAINTFCSGTSCTVYQWLDQSGNGNTATAAAQANEPTIYTGGAIVKDNGKVALDFDGSNDELTHSISGLVNGNFTYIDTFKSSDAAAILHSSTTTNTKWVMIAQTSTSTQLSDGFLTAYDGYFKNGVQPLSSGATRTDFKNAFFDGGQNLAFYFGTTSSTAVSEMYMGRYQASGFHFDGLVQESILYTSDKSSVRTSIESNVGDYFTQNTPLLDTYSGAAGAYSLRKLSSSYSGSAIRVRRSSDNTEQDIGFNVFGELDTVSLLAFAGASGNAWVRTWYDQSGNSNDATQTTTSNQPKIVSNGTVETFNGKPSVRFINASTTYLDVVEFAVESTMTYFDVHKANGFRNVWSPDRNENATLADSTNFVLGAFYDGLTASIGGVLKAPETANDTQAERLVYWLRDGANSELGLNGTTALTGTQLSSANNRIRIGTKSGLQSPFDGHFSELIAYPSDQSANRTNIESNINTFYSIS